MMIAQAASRTTHLGCLTKLVLIASIALTVAQLCQSARADPQSSPRKGAQPDSASPDLHSNGIRTNEEHKLPQVTVEARRRLERRVNEFVKKITNVPFSLQDSLPLWHDPLCFAVAGLSTDQGLFALGRLAEIARATGLRVARSGCKYNFIVIFSAEPDKLLKQAFHLHPHSFNTDGGVTELKQFIAPAKPQAVRAWHNTLATTRSGVPIQLDGACGSFSVQGVQIPVSCQYDSSRIERFDVYAFSLALVVIDTSYPKEFKLGQLVDYAAFAGLTKIPTDLALGDAPSILRLLEESSDAEPPGLTDWDSAFLRALYHSDQGNTMQRTQIAVQMLDEVGR